VSCIQNTKHKSHPLIPFPSSLSSFVSFLQFATGEGSVDELSGLTTKLGNFSAMVDTLENGPLKKMVLTLRDQAMAQLKDVKGAEKVSCLVSPSLLCLFIQVLSNPPLSLLIPVSLPPSSLPTITPS